MNLEVGRYVLVTLSMKMV